MWCRLQMMRVVEALVARLDLVEERLAVALRPAAA
jgi:hypothetical protein